MMEFTSDNPWSVGGITGAWRWERGTGERRRKGNAGGKKKALASIWRTRLEGLRTRGLEVNGSDINKTSGGKNKVPYDMLALWWNTHSDNSRGVGEITGAWRWGKRDRREG